MSTAVNSITPIGQLPVHHLHDNSAFNAPVGGSAVGGTGNNILINNYSGARRSSNEQTDGAQHSTEAPTLVNTSRVDIRQVRSESASGTYARILAKAIGYPLWIPEPSHQPPEYRKEGVSIGDVGIITYDGRFKFLFNICLSATHPINHRAPPSFTSFGYNEDEVERTSLIFPSGEVILSNTIEGPADPQGNEPDSEPVEYRFNCSPEEGALLVLPDGASRFDLSFRKNILKHTQRHALSWCEHIYGTLGLEAEAGPLYLVTGADKCRNWCLGSYSNTLRNMSLRFTKRNLTTPCTIPLYRAYSGPANASTFYPENLEEIYTNQCVFIRGYRITPSRSLLKKILAGPVEISDLITPHHSVSKGGRALGTTLQQRFTQVTSKNNPSSDKHQLAETLVVDTFPTEFEPYHPSNVINTHLLNTVSNAHIAITHDDVWRSVVKIKDPGIPNAQELLRRVVESFDVVQTAHCISVVPKSQTDTNPRPTSLHSAALTGNENMIRLLFDNNADVNARDSDGATPLLWAVRRGNEEVVRILLKSGADANIRDKSQKAPLHCAAEQGNERVLRLLLEKGAQVNIQDMHNSTPTHVAAERGHEMMVNLLLEKGANINVCDDEGKTPLHWGARRGSELMIKMLLQKGANVNATDKDEVMALHLAAERGNEPMVTLLLEEGANVNATDKDTKAALHWAAEGGHEKVVRLLLKKGAYVSQQDKDGFTALHSAAKRGDETIFRLLLEKSGNINALDKGEKTVLQWATEGEHETIVRMLFEKGAAVDAQDTFMLLCIATKRRNEAILRLLLEKGADMNAQNTATLLGIAIKSGFKTAIRLLLEKEVDLSARDGTTALHVAAKQEIDTVVKLFLEEGADINARDKDGKTPLHEAAKQGSQTVVKLILEGGADISAQDKDGKTALHGAVQRCMDSMMAKWLYSESNDHQDQPNEHETVVSLLLNSGANVGAWDREVILTWPRNIKDAIKRTFSVPNSHPVRLFKIWRSQNKDGLEIVRLLLEKGADVNAQDKDGKTALDLVAKIWKENCESERNYDGEHVFAGASSILVEKADGETV